MAIFPSYHDELRLVPTGFRRNRSARIDLLLWSQSPPVAPGKSKEQLCFPMFINFRKLAITHSKWAAAMPLLGMRDSTHDRRVFFPCAMSGDVGAGAVRSSSALAALSLELTIPSSLLAIHRCEGGYAEDLDPTPLKQRVGGSEGNGHFEPEIGNSVAKLRRGRTGPLSSARGHRPSAPRS